MNKSIDDYIVSNYNKNKLVPYIINISILRKNIYGSTNIKKFEENIYNEVVNIIINNTEYKIKSYNEFETIMINKYNIIYPFIEIMYFYNNKWNLFIIENDILMSLYNDKYIEFIT